MSGELFLESFCKRDFGRELLLGELLGPNLDFPSTVSAILISRETV